MSAEDPIAEALDECAMVAESLMSAAGHGRDELRDAAAALDIHQARFGAAFIATMHARLTLGRVRHVPDGFEDLLAAAERGFGPAAEITKTLPEAEAKAAAAQLAWTFRDQRAGEISGELGLN